MNNKIIIGSLVAATVIIGLGSVAWAASNNYAGFRAMMGNRAPLVTEKNFDRFTQMQRNMVDGNYAEAQKIRTELGLGQGRGNGGGCPMHNGARQGRGRGQAGGCPMANGGRDANFVDANNNGVCDHMENLK